MTLIYLDASAMVKLVVEEPESPALAEWLDERPDQPLCTSVIGKVEVLRAARRHSQHALAVASSVLSQLALVPTDAAVLELAASLEPGGLRTLDAIHLTGRLEGVILDTVYEGKSMAGLVDLVRTGDIPPTSTVLYAHLGGQPALNAYASLFLPEG